jgi:hypothetical protein
MRRRKEANEVGRIATHLALAGVGALALRALAPKLHTRLLAACEHMFDEAPDSFPPKRMLRGIEEIRANSARTLVLLEERELPGERNPVSEGVRS